ncbi:hypothetical protein KGQ20_25745 [Catenulispora sp. NF23]|uniref:Uncharacterized protein n=1 Tax=Catenulispora pinistramenti TaxID=2705254 RepID=A0ABS5L190_9ACTN|nr:hypothetical protein [Catenulispora pinistramenti]MBS2536172.1 hypothetical protein [Catenulispora pinistramenti]MBS2552084.1 hypothetical protein [Catenulispora pinistramenti]
MWGVLAALVCGLVLGGLGTLGAVLAYAKRHPGLLVEAAFEYGLDRPEAGDSAKTAPQL